jgi:hypothetical protein
MTMNAGKTLFAQLMDFLPWSTFNRYVTRYSGDKGIRTLSCAEQFRVMAFAQLTYSEDLGLELSNTVYALDSTTIDLCLSVFPWAHFRTTKAAVKMHTLLDLRGSIPSFIHVSDGKLHDVHALDLLVPEPGVIYVMDRGYVDFARLYRLHLAGAFFVTRAKSNLKAHRVIRLRWTAAPAFSATRRLRWMAFIPNRITPRICAGFASTTRKPASRLSSSPIR